MKKTFILFVLCLVPVMAGAQMISSSTMTVTKIQKVKEKKKLEPVQPRFQQSVEFSFNLFDEFYISTKYIAGYRFNNWFFLGGGTGLTFMIWGGGYNDHYHYNHYLYGNNNSSISNTLVNIPLFLHLRTYLTRSRVNPYIGLSAGGLLSTKGNTDCKYYNDETKKSEVFNYEFSNCRGMIEPSFGINIRLKRKWDLYLAFTALTTFEPYCYRPSDNSTPSVVHRPSVSLGFNLGMSF